MGIHLYLKCPTVSEILILVDRRAHFPQVMTQDALFLTLHLESRNGDRG